MSVVLSIFLKLVALTIALFIFAIIDELLTRKKRRRWLIKNRPDLFKSQVAKSDDQEFINTVERFRNGV